MCQSLSKNGNLTWKWWEMGSYITLQKYVITGNGQENHQEFLFKTELTTQFWWFGVWWKVGLSTKTRVVCLAIATFGLTSLVLKRIGAWSGGNDDANLLSFGGQNLWSNMLCFSNENGAVISEFLVILEHYLWSSRRHLCHLDWGIPAYKIIKKGLQKTTKTYHNDNAKYRIPSGNQHSNDQLPTNREFST